VALALLGADWADHPVNRWVKQSPTKDAPAPAYSWEGSGAYDPLGKQWIHYGGHDGIPQGFHLFTYGLASRTWRQRFPNTSPNGVCCVDGAATFDVANRRFVRFPGASLGHGYQWSRGVLLKDSAVWLYDPAANTWTNMRPPPYATPFGSAGLGRLNAGATYDPRHELAVSFGGQANSGTTSNLFFYDAYANALYRVHAKGAPPPRDGMGLVCDPKQDCLVVFGSQYSSDEKTWIYRFRTGKWESHALDPHPPAKKGKTYSTIPKMAYDPLNEICLCVVWDDATGKHQTWAFDVAKLKWSKLSPAVEPEPSMSRSRNLAFSTEHKVFLLETNPAKSRGTGAQLWTYRYKKVAPRKLPLPPVNLEAVTGADKVVLSWKASGAGIKEYHVYRASSAEPWKLSFKKLATTRKPTFEDRDVTAGKFHFYAVKAIAVGGAESGFSFRARSQPRVVLKPVVSVRTAERVEVRWNAHPARDIAGYNVYRGLVRVRCTTKGEPKPWRDNDPRYDAPTPVEVRDITGLKKLNDRPLTRTSFLDRVSLSRPGPESGGYKYAVHAYVLRAVNKLGVESGPSPYALTIPSEPANVLSREKGNIAELKWDANPEKGIAGYRVYKLDGIWSIVRLTAEPLKRTTFKHKARGVTRYWVVAVDALGQEGQPSSPVWHGRRYKGFFKGEWHQ
jgi:hypothetical protein